VCSYLGHEISNVTELFMVFLSTPSSAADIVTLIMTDVFCFYLFYPLIY
jgi:hypothetical protein